MSGSSWTADEDQALIEAFEKVSVGNNGAVNWQRVSNALGGNRSKNSCKKRHQKLLASKPSLTAEKTTVTSKALRRPRGRGNVGWGTMPEDSRAGTTQHLIENSIWAAHETRTNPRTQAMRAGNASGLPIDWTEDMVEKRYANLKQAINDALRTGEMSLLMYVALDRGAGFVTISGNGDVSKKGEGRIVYETFQSSRIEDLMRGTDQFWCQLRVFPWYVPEQRDQKRKRVCLFAYDHSAGEWLKMKPEVCEDECENNPQMFCVGGNCVYSPDGVKIWLDCDYY